MILCRKCRHERCVSHWEHLIHSSEFKVHFVTFCASLSPCNEEFVLSVRLLPPVFQSSRVFFESVNACIWTRRGREAYLFQSLYRNVPCRLCCVLVLGMPGGEGFPPQRLQAVFP